MTDNSGNLIQEYLYDSFGKIQNSLAPDLKQPYGYTGREWDEELGLYFYRARYYDPASGRFLTQDPNEFKGGINFYAYVKNDPVNWVDPWGLARLRSPGSQYYLGREESLLPPGSPVGAYLENYVTHLNQASIFHDGCVFTLVHHGIPDIIANYPTMIPAYAAATIYNNLTDYSQPNQNNFIFFQVNW